MKAIGKKIKIIIVSVGLTLSILASGVCSIFVWAQKADHSAYKDIVIYDTTSAKELQTIEKPEVKVGVISDVHISSYFLGSGNEFHGDTVNKLKLALKFYQRQKVDLLLMTGDVVDLAEESDYQLLVQTLNEVYGSKENAPTIVYTFGNHEFSVFKRDENGAITGTEELGWAKSFERHKQYMQPWLDYEIWNGQTGENSSGERVNLIECNGVYVINYNENTEFRSEDLARLDALLAEATSKTDKPVLVSFHYAFGSDLYGISNPMWLDDSAYEQKLTAVFKKYPQAVVLLGHQHASALHGRSISQSLGFTSLLSGASNTMAVYDMITGVTDITDKTTPRYANYYGYEESMLGVNGQQIIKRHNIGYSGLLLTFADGKMTSNVVDFKKNIIIDDVNVFEIPYGITLDNKDEKFAYTIDKLKEKQEALTFEIGATVSLSVKNNQLVVKFPSVVQYNDCEGYKIQLEKEGEETKVIYWQSNFMFYPTELVEYQVFINDIESIDGWTVSVSPIDFYGQIGEAIKKVA